MANYYEILGVEVNATPEQLKAAWKEKLKFYHPDKPTGDAVKAQEANDAYGTLSDPDKRAAYDRGKGISSAVYKTEDGKTLDQRLNEIETELNAAQNERSSIVTKYNEIVRQFNSIKATHGPYVRSYYTAREKYDEAQVGLSKVRAKLRNIHIDAFNETILDDLENAQLKVITTKKELGTFSASKINLGRELITSVDNQFTLVKNELREKEEKIAVLSIERQKITRILNEENSARAAHEDETIIRPAERFAWYPLSKEMPYKWGSVFDLSLTKIWNNYADNRKKMTKKEELSELVKKARIFINGAIGIVSYLTLPDTIPFAYKVAIAGGVVAANKYLMQHAMPVAMTIGDIAGVTLGKAILAATKPKSLAPELQRAGVHYSGSFMKVAFALASVYVVTSEAHNFGQDVVQKHLLDNAHNEAPKSLVYKAGEYVVGKITDAPPAITLNAAKPS